MKSGLLRLITALIIITAIQSYAPAARAVVVTWTLDGVTFDDGAMATGSFDYDADTNMYSAINLTTTAGVLPGETYTTASVASNATFLELLIITNTFLQLNFSAPLTNAGGVIGVTGQEARLIFGPVRDIVAGSVVPVPAALPLFLSGLAVFGFIARRRRSAAAA